MSEWSVVLVISALVGLLATILPPVVRLNTSITRLTVTMENITGDLSALSSKNSDTHGRIFERLGSHDKALAEQDKRIHVMEQKKEAV